MKNPEQMTDQDILSFQQEMEAKYPLMLSGKYGGIDVHPGWFSILELLFNSIQSHIDFEQKRNPYLEQVVVLQIKEKFGALRFYYTGGNEYISGLVAMAEAVSSTTCEVCGSYGRIRSNGGWLRATCDKHYEGDKDND